MRISARTFLSPLPALLLAVAGCSSNDAGPAVAVDPAAVYGQMCARCHGADGKGDPEIKKMMPVRDFTDPAFQAIAKTDMVERVIMGGRGQMPAFGGTMSTLKIQSLAGYVRRLAAAGGGGAAAGEGAR
jgi:mono/diheme cytochrome c family protein